MFTRYASLLLVGACVISAPLFSNPIKATKPGVIAAHLALPCLPENVQDVVEEYFTDDDANRYVLKKGTKAYDKIKDTGASPVYGEILPRSVQKLLKALDITSSDVIYDMGSGRGEFSILAAMLTPVKHSKGIELAKPRFDVSKEILADLESKGILQKGRVQFIEDDFYNQPMADATIVYACSTCFATMGMDKLANKLFKLPNLRYFVTLKKLETPKKLGFKETMQVVIPTTWSPKSIAYVYIKAGKNPKGAEGK